MKKTETGSPAASGLYRGSTRVAAVAPRRGGSDLISAVADYYHHYRSIKGLDYLVMDLLPNLLDLAYIGLVGTAEERKKVSVG